MSLRESWSGEDNEQSQKFKGKTEKSLKTNLFAQNTRFLQLSQVASKSPEHLRQKFWKFYLSVFHNWKFNPRGSREVSCENL